MGDRNSSSGQQDSLGSNDIGTSNSNPDMGGANFGVSDGGSWDDAGSGDSGGSGDWDN
jgi:hypothetical protein